MQTLYLTGSWNGFYEYGETYSKSLRGVRKDFVLNLREIKGTIYGECIDISEDYRNNLKAEIKGFIKGNLISFIKQYPYYHYTNKDGKTVIDYDKEHPEIEYIGYYNESYKNFEGTWQMVIRTRVSRFGGFKIVKVFEQSLRGNWEMKRAEES